MFQIKNNTAGIAAAHGAWARAKASGKIIAVAAYDLSAAFDTLDASMLLEKMTTFGITGTEAKWFSHYLTERQQRVVANGESSPLLPVQFGVPQGSILGPALFLLAVADLPRALDFENDSGGTIGYADDTVLWVIAPTINLAKSRLEQASRVVLDYTARHHLALNPEKTQILWPFVQNPPPVCIGGVLVDGSSNLDILGVSYDTKLRALPAIKLKTASARGILGKVRCLGRHLPQSAIATIARTLVAGKVGYSAAATFTPRFSEEDSCHGPTQALQVVVNDVARAVLSVPRRRKTPVTTLLKKTSLPSINQMTAKAIALETWKAIRVRDGPDGEPNPLGLLLGEPGSGLRVTRAAAEDFLPPALKTAQDTFVWTGMKIWNACPSLRCAKSLSAAKKAAHSWSKTLPT